MFSAAQDRRAPIRRELGVGAEQGSVDVLLIGFDYGIARDAFVHALSLAPEVTAARNSTPQVVIVSLLVIWFRNLSR